MLDVSEGGFDTLGVPEGGGSPSSAAYARSRSRNLHPPSISGSIRCLPFVYVKKFWSMLSNMQSGRGRMSSLTSCTFTVPFF